MRVTERGIRGSTSLPPAEHELSHLPSSKFLDALPDIDTLTTQLDVETLAMRTSVARYVVGLLEREDVAMLRSGKPSLCCYAVIPRPFMSL